MPCRRDVTSLAACAGFEPAAALPRAPGVKCDGRRVRRAAAIRNTRTRAETYSTFRQGQRAEVEVSTQCPRCYSEYLRTNQDSTTKNNLLELPDC